jgi:hypothetical protein
MAKTKVFNLKKVVPSIFLESTENFNPRHFFKTEDEGGIFAHVDKYIFNLFDEKVKNSPAKELGSYEFTGYKYKIIHEDNIISEAKAEGIYDEVDSAHIMQICERQIVKGEKLLNDEGCANLFCTRNKKGELYKVEISLFKDGWFVLVRKFRASNRWDTGTRLFFSNLKSVKSDSLFSIFLKKLKIGLFF